MADEKTPALMDPDIPMPGQTLEDRILTRQGEQKKDLERNAVPGSDAAAAVAQREALEASSLELLEAGAKQTAAYGIYRYAADELGGEGDDPNYKRSEHFHELTKGIPFQYHDEIMDAGSLAGAQRVRARIEEDFKTMQLLMNSGTMGAAYNMAGQVFDVDIALAIGSKGTYTAAKIGRMAAMANRMGLSVKASARAASVLQGAKEGAKAGFVVEGLNATVRETGDWREVPAALLDTAMLGAAFGGVTPTRREQQAILRERHDDYVTRWENDEINGPEDVDTPVPDAHRMGEGSFADEAEKLQKEGDTALETLRATRDSDTAGETPSSREEFLARLEARRKSRGGRTLPGMAKDMAMKVYDRLEAKRRAAGHTPESDAAATKKWEKRVGVKIANDLDGRPTNESINAARNPDFQPTDDYSRTIAGYVDDAQMWRADTGFNDAKRKEAGQWYTKALDLMDKAGLAGDHFRFYQTRSAVANWLSTTVLESPSGVGRQAATAATRMEAYTARIMTKFMDPYTQHMKIWAKENGGTQFGGLHVTADAGKQFGRQVHLEVNARRNGRPSTTDNASVKAAADAIEEAAQEAYGIARGRDGELAVDGFEDIVQKVGYSPIIWQGRAMRDMVQLNKARKQEVIGSIEDGYVNAGMPRDVAEKVAKAVYNRAVRNDAGFDMSLVNLLRADGSEYLRDMLVDKQFGAGLSPTVADDLIEKLRGPLEERGKQGFAKARNEIDLSTPMRGSLGEEGYSLVDLMDNDMTSVWSRYGRSVAGSSALARAGITNRAKRSEIKDAIREEQIQLGEEPFSPEYIDDVFTHFDAGPIAGGVDPNVMRAKRLTNLSLLNKLGLTQAGEMGATIAAGGWENFVQHSRAFSKALDNLYADAAKANPEGILDELRPLMGDIGKEHQFFRDDLALDETRMSRAEHSELTGWLDRVLAKGSRVQGFMSGFYHVRQAQQRLAVTTMVDRSFQWLSKSEGTVDRLTEIGIPPATQRYMREKLADGTIEMPDGYVNRMNIDRWEYDHAEIFSNALHRHQNQVVQKAMAGEDNVWMHKSVASLLVHLKSFPLLAISKQGLRHARMQDPTALATLFMGLGTAGLAYIVKQLVEGRTDRLSPSEVMKGAFGMSNMTGFVPMMTDPVATMFGLEDWRFNQYGPHTEMTIPTLEVANRLGRAPGAVFDAITGNADGYDRMAIRAIPGMNYFGVSILTNEIGR